MYIDISRVSAAYCYCFQRNKNGPQEQKLMDIN